MLLFLALQRQFIGGVLGTRRKGRKASESGICPGQMAPGSEQIHPSSGAATTLGEGGGKERDGGGLAHGDSTKLVLVSSKAETRGSCAPPGLISGPWLSPSLGPWSGTGSRGPTDVGLWLGSSWGSEP